MRNSCIFECLLHCIIFVATNLDEVPFLIFMVLIFMILFSIHTQKPPQILSLKTYNSARLIMFNEGLFFFNNTFKFTMKRKHVINDIAQKLRYLKVITVLAASTIT